MSPSMYIISYRQWCTWQATQTPSLVSYSLDRIEKEAPAFTNELNAIFIQKDSVFLEAFTLEGKVAKFSIFQIWGPPIINNTVTLSFVYFQ